VRLEELHCVWSKLNWLPKWQIVHESWMVSRTLFLMEFELHLVDLTFIQKIHKGLQMSLKDINKSLYPSIALKLLDKVFEELRGPTVIYIDS
jgi:hypothetical protein